MAVKDIKEYEIIKQYYMEDLNSQAYLLKHKRQEQELRYYQMMIIIKFLILVLEHRK